MQKEKYIKLSDGSNIGFDKYGNITVYNCALNIKPKFSIEDIQDIEKILKEFKTFDNPKQ